MKRFDRFAIGVDYAVFDRLEIALDIGQWGTKFVGDVGRQLPASLPCYFQVAGHGVEGNSQLPDIVAARFGYALAQVARTESACRGRKASDRGHRLAGKYCHDQQPGQSAGDSRDQERPLE